MRIAIRADASVQIGTGHVMRCLALAHALRERGATVVFVTRELPGNLCDLIAAQGLEVLRLPASDTPPAWSRDAGETMEALRGKGTLDWLVIDSYRLDARWERVLRPLARGLLVIDDLADRPHEADVLLDQGMYERMQERYAGRVGGACRRLLGPEYALLRNEFRAERVQARPRTTLSRLFIFFGGSDPANETAKVLDALAAPEFSALAMDVVAGSSNPHGDRIAARCKELPVAVFHRQAGNMAALMAAADLSIGAGGTASWERCCVGLPSLTAVLADNQRDQTAMLAVAGAQIDMGPADKLRPDHYREAVQQLMGEPSRLAAMSQKAFGLVDGEGAQRVAAVMTATPRI